MDLPAAEAAHRPDLQPAAAAVDLLLAYGAGPLPWIDHDDRNSVACRSTVAIGLVSLAWMISVEAAIAIWNPTGHRIGVQIGLTAAGALCMVGFGSGLVSVERSTDFQSSTSVMVTIRTLLCGGFLTTWVAATTPIAALLLAPFGLLVGADLGLTTYLVGLRQSIRSNARAYLCSPAHLGAITAVATTVIVFRTTRVTRTAVAVCLGVEVTALTAIVTIGLVGYLFRREVKLTAFVRGEERRFEFRRRAHWIHDDVCADIRGLRVRFAAQPLSAGEIETELEELEYRLRLRQLDEALSGGTVTAAEVLQPFLRRLQNHGVRMLILPRFDDASIEVQGWTADILKRCVAGLTANSLAAGATELGVEIHATTTHLTLRVSDNAGGFDLADVPAGRGLAALAADLGAGNLVVDRIEDGALVTATISLDATA